MRQAELIKACRTTSAALLVAGLAVAGCSRTEPHSMRPRSSSALSAPVFPLRVSANGRYLEDQSGVPFPILGESAWEAAHNLGTTDQATMVSDRASRGFTALLLEAISHKFTVSRPPRDLAGNLPFTKRLDGTAFTGSPNGTTTASGNAAQFAADDYLAPSVESPDFTTPNEAYWAGIDAFIALCASNGLAVFVYPTYYGYGSGDEGWNVEMVQNDSVAGWGGLGPTGYTDNTRSKLWNFSAWLANRYRSYSNIVWILGGDSGVAGCRGAGTLSAAQSSAVLRVYQGMTSVPGQASTLFTGHWGRCTLSTDIGSDATNGAALRNAISLNASYADVSSAEYARGGYDYSAAKLPTFELEGYYENASAGGSPNRRLIWWSWLGGIGGYFFGNESEWRFAADWSATLSSPGAVDAARLNAFVGSIPWWTLVPSGLGGQKTLITSGGGTDSPQSTDYVAAAADLAGTLLVAYVPPAHSGAITVDLTGMAGPVTAHWVDPTSGASAVAGGSPFPNAGAQAFAAPGTNSGGANDWVLVLTSAAVANAAPTVAAAASASPNPVSGATAALSVLGADDGGEAALSYGWSVVGSAPAAVAFSATGTNAAKNATATFTQPGNYALRATIFDAYGLSVSSDVAVTVVQALTAIQVVPANASLGPGGTQQFVAVANDQFGAALSPQPALAWSVNGGGVISSSGLFAASAGAGGSFTVTASSGGKSGTAGASVVSGIPVALGAVADAYVRDGPSATVPFGTATELQSKSSSPGYSRRSFLKFDLGGVPAQVASAKLRLFGGTGGSGPISLQAFGVADTSWSETGVNWNNQPTASTGALATAVVNGAGGQWYEWDVSAYVQTEKGAGRTLISLVLVDPSASAPVCDYSTAFNSREAGANGPQLAVAAPVINQAPTIATAAAASPNPVTSTTTSLSVLGADDGGEASLTYTWAVTGTPPASVIFGANGTNAAKSSTATFTTAGSYTLQVTIADAQGLTAVGSVAVAVSQAATSVAVSPSSASVASGGTQQYAATVSDQFGAALSPQPAFAWSVSGGGSVSANGLFTSSGSAGSFTVTASSGGASGAAAVQVAAPVNQAPTVAAAPAASPSPVTSNSTHLSVLGADDGGEANLTYTWAVTGTPPAPVSFSANGTNAAKSSTATFSKAGAYALQVTITDAQGLTAVGSVAVAVTQTLSSIVVSPPSASVMSGGTQQYAATASDQFGAALAAQPAFTWSVNGGGAVSSGGLFTSTGGAGSFTVTASSGGASGAAAVQVAAPVNQAPTVAAAPAASPSPVTSNSTHLSVLGADDGGEANLTYTWAVTGTPPAPVSFSANGTNAAKSSTATFSKAGAYALQVTITDAQGLTAVGSIAVAVTQTLSSIVVSPPSASVMSGGTQQYAATASDQFGAALAAQPAFTWSVNGGGAVSSGGLFTSTGGAGSFTVTASSGGASGAAAVQVAAPVNQAPTVAAAPAASPSPVTSNSTHLSVLGADDGGEANLTYTWAVTGTPPAPVSFSANGTNAAKSSTATFSKAGAYALQVTITDAQGLTAVGSIAVAVTQTLSSIVVSPPSASVVSGGTQQYAATASDQFGAALSPQPAFAWTVSGGGTISSGGLFTAGSSAGGPFTVTAGSGSTSGTATATVTALPPPITIGQPTVLSIDDANNGNWLIAQSATLSQAATINTLSFYAAAAAGKLRMGIYDASGPGGGPGVKKAETAEVTPVVGWNAASVTAPVLLAAGTYWLAYLSSDDRLHSRRTGNGGGACQYFVLAYGALPASFSTLAIHDTVQWSLSAKLQP